MSGIEEEVEQSIDFVHSSRDHEAGRYNEERHRRRRHDNESNFLKPPKGKPLRSKVPEPRQVSTGDQAMFEERLKRLSNHQGSLGSTVNETGNPGSSILQYILTKNQS